LEIAEFKRKWSSNKRGIEGSPTYCLFLFEFVII
jgi:hypothetical protein